MPRTEPTDLDQLLVAVAAGNRPAFETLYDRTADMVFGVARKVLIDRSLAREVAQDVMLEIWRSADRFDPSRGTALGWMATMARRRAIDVVRATEASRRREAEQPRTPEPGDVVSERVLQGEEAKRVKVAMSQLSDLQREAVALAFYRGLTHREIAEHLEVPLGTVKTRIRDGLLRMGAIMGEQDE